MSERPTRAEKRARGDRSQSLAKALRRLAPDQVAALDVDDELKDEIETGRETASPIAGRREEKRLAGVLRAYDLDAVEGAIGALRTAAPEGGDVFQRAEGWRAQLLEETDAALERFLTEVPSASRDALSPLIKSAQKEDATGRPRGAKKKLFRALRALLEGDGAV